VASREVDRSAGYHRPGSARRALLVDPAAYAPWIPAAQARRMSPPSRYAVAALRLALADAGLAEDDPGFAATAIVMGTAFGPAQVTEQLLDAILHRGPEAASPALFTESVANAPAAQMALAVRALGPNLTIPQREASDFVALAEASRLLAAGKAVRALVGTADEMIPLLHAILDRMGALARADAAGREIARPLDRARDGITAAEGGAVLLLEERGAALARGARLRCRVEATGTAFDATATNVDWGVGEELLARALRRSLDRAGIELATIDRVILGASGARRGDRLAARTLARLFAGSPPPVVAPKGIVGEYGGGFLASAALAASGAPVAPPSGFANPDPELGIAPARGPLAPPRRCLALALASSGAAAWAILAAP
jgi:3-oxoacyl-(acyl-carrier-protein) synthase